MKRNFLHVRVDPYRCVKFSITGCRTGPGIVRARVPANTLTGLVSEGMRCLIENADHAVHTGSIGALAAQNGTVQITCRVSGTLKTAPAVASF